MVLYLQVGRTLCETNRPNIGLPFFTSTVVQHSLGLSQRAYGKYFIYYRFKYFLFFLKLGLLLDDRLILRVQSHQLVECILFVGINEIDFYYYF